MAIVPGPNVVAPELTVAVPGSVGLEGVGLGLDAGLPVQDLPCRRHPGVPDQRAGQVGRLRGKRLVISAGEVAWVSVTL